MKLRFATLQSRHRLWRDLEVARSQRPRKWVPPPFWEELWEERPRGETETFRRIWVQAPGWIRVEQGEQVWLARGRRWWHWGGSMPALRGRGSVNGHLELDRLAPLLDPAYHSIGWALPAPDSRAEPMNDGRLNRRVTGFSEGRPCEVSELLEPIIDAPVDPSIFVPRLPFQDRDEVLPTPHLSPQDAARRLPFILFAPAPNAVPDPMFSGVVAVLLPPAWASLSYGDRRRRPQIRLDISQRAAIEPAPDRWEERVSSAGHPWLHVTLHREDTEIELSSLYDRMTTAGVVNALRPVKRD